MTLLILAYLAGVLTILSPCILPVLPFVFSRVDQPFMRTGLPLLLGMAAAFAGVATLAAVGGGWAVETNQYGRFAALVLLALFAATLLSDRLAQNLARPLVVLGQRQSLQSTVAGARPGPLSSVVLGIATGLLWAPCAGPILGLVLTGAPRSMARASRPRSCYWPTPSARRHHLAWLFLPAAECLQSSSGPSARENGCAEVLALPC